MRRVMASAASARCGMQQKVTTGSMRLTSGDMQDKSPSLSPSPPQFRQRHFGSSSSTQTNSGSSKGGNQSDSDSGIVSGMRDLSVQSRDKTASHQFENRRTFCSTNNRVILRNLTDVASMLRENRAKNVVIVAGAGISTPSGIPDFRTPGTGLYDNLQQYNIPYPEAIFDIDFFHHNPRPFFTLAKELYPSGKYRPNYIHYLARLLNDRGILLRMYTQNIDGLERLAGVPPDKLVEAHGTFSTASCIVCEEKYRGSEIKESFFNDKLPKCTKRGCYGIVKPDIVFFGEELPKRFYFYLKDMLQTDMVLVMGTSLEVQPFAGIIDTVRWTVPRVLFNRNAVGPFKSGKRAKDFIAEGDLIECLQSFVQMAGMKEEMVDLITKSEGTFRLAAPPPPSPSASKTANKSAKAKGGVKPDPVLTAMWRQNAQLDMYSDSESSETSDFDDSSSESTSDSDKQQQQRHQQPSGGGGASNKKQGQVSKNSKLQSKPPGARGFSSLLGGGRAAGLGGPSSRTTPVGKPPTGKAGGGPAAVNRNNASIHNINSSPSRNFSLLSRRKDNSGSANKTFASPKSTSARDNSVSPGVERRYAKPDSKWAVSPVRRKPQIDLGISPHRKPPQAPGSHPVKPRSSSVNKAVPEKAHSKATGIRSVINRVRSAQTPKITYHHRPSQKPAYDARMMTVLTTGSNSSSSDDDDADEDGEDVDEDDSTSDDSR